ncbi:PTC7 [Candida oxycetoniae]|uniref:Protein phosphatase n=1 Tax=Candida oxycetoniae TaxID=497107 RepID=A0AAI9WVX4_9ASCO|nr:PTC7 [Candida oxycetoniae]KAI3402631.2 PTC7 [Candida oxycetoniae]
MLLSLLIKRSSVPINWNVFKVSIYSTSRNLSGSSSSWGSYSSNGSKSSGGGGGGSSTAANTLSGTSVPPASSTSASLNYDTALTSFTNYSVAVAYQPKDRKKASTNLFKKKPLNNSAAVNSPIGEDNLFVSKELRDGSIAVGVADGVGGWSEAGYDSSAISRELCASIKKAFEKQQSSARASSPKELLDFAFKEVLKSDKVEIGGTTACLGVFTPDSKILRVANLGDSWCGLFRDNKLIENTKFQTHNFNTPFQLAKIPETIVRQAAMEGRRYIIDTPQMADEYIWNCQKDDIVIFATDGVTDNIVPQDIEIFLNDHLKDNKNVQLDAVANTLVDEVVKVSKDPNYPSAFAQELSKITGQRYLGGKEDDVSLVLIRVL